MEIDCSGDETPVEWQPWVLLFESEVALGGVQGETGWKGGEVVVDVPIDGQDLLIDPITVVLDYLSSRASMLICQAMILENARDSF
jgi:hypothetical protein